MATSACQICFDNSELVSNVCGRSCSAEVCRQCMGRHVQVTLQQFYPGVLPRVRCPVCLVALHFSRWVSRVPVELKTELTTKYSELCRQACAVTPPCCDDKEYTHLPPYYPGQESEAPLKLLPSLVAQFRSLCKQFCRHKVEPRVVLDYAFDTFGEEKAHDLVTNQTLPRIHDPERRATLLLSLLYLRPNTTTRCCGTNFCFNCKRRNHHNTCIQEFDEDNDLVRCRTCRVLLLMVEGCDSVICVCGFNMSWSKERELRQQRKKGLVPVDIFDIPLADDWLAFRGRLAQVMVDMRTKWTYKWVAAVRPRLHPVFVVHLWRFRLRKILATQLSAAWTVRRAKSVDQQIEAVKGVLRMAMATHIWHRRFNKALTVMGPEMYWKAYHRWHPEELEDEEEDSIFSIGCF